MHWPQAWPKRPRHAPTALPDIVFETATETIRELVSRLRGQHDHGGDSDEAPVDRRLPRSTLSALGLHRQPFDDHAVADELFVDDAIEMQVNMLSEQLRSGEMLPLLKGEDGSGKTSLLILLMTRSNDRFHYFVARGQEDLRAEQIIIDMLRLLVRPVPEEPRECFRELARRLRRLVADDRPAVLVIDDADRLADEQLNNLLAAHDSLSGALGGHFRLLLAARPSIELRLPQLTSKQLRSGHVFATDMRPLARPRIGPYLERRLAVAGLEGTVPFDEDALDRIARRGGGLPRSIEAAAAEELDAHDDGR